MNEQIKKFAEQSGMIVDKFGMGVSAEPDCGVDIEKFAELIVQECINTLDNVNSGHWTSEGALEMAGTLIRKKFGVK